MKPFKKNELIGIVVIVLVIFTVTGLNMKIALRRSRDSQRRQDLGSLSDALHAFYSAYGFFPPSEGGKIKACKGPEFDTVSLELKTDKEFDRNKFFRGLQMCDFGKDSLTDVMTGEVYLPRLPQDPKGSEKMTYVYLSNSERFQLYSSLEGENAEEGYNQGIVSRNISCGIKVCSFGKSFAETPLDISIEEYEQALSEKQKSGKP